MTTESKEKRRRAFLFWRRYFFHRENVSGWIQSQSLNIWTRGEGPQLPHCAHPFLLFGWFLLKGRNSLVKHAKCHWRRSLSFSLFGISQFWQEFQTIETVRSGFAFRCAQALPNSCSASSFLSTEKYSAQKHSLSWFLSTKNEKRASHSWPKERADGMYCDSCVLMCY